jgi:tetratricopeptide (TPR) repeat protein
LAQLQSFSREQPAYEPWCAYFGGILTSERDHDWAEAERVFSRLLQADLNLPLRGRVLMALGKIYKYQGRWEEAIRAYEGTSPLFAALDSPIDQAKAWKQIAISYRRGFTRGDFGPQALQRAMTHCQLALDVLEPITHPPPDVAWIEGSVWNTLGLIHRDLGQWDEAIACYRQDLDICRSLDDRFGMGLSYGNLGEIYQKQGQDYWPEALKAYRKALSIIREFDDHYEETEVLANLGFLHQEMGEYPLALDYYSQAIELIEYLRADISSEAARAGFFTTIADTYANTVLLCLETGDERRAFDLVERARSRAFLDALSARSPELARKMEAPTLTLAEVQAALPDDALLIEYFTTGLVEAQDGRPTAQRPERHRFPPARTLILAVTRDGLQVHDASISPNDLRPRQLDSVVERHFLRPEIRRTLYDRLIGPVEHLLRGRRRLYLVPHGPLHYIPFQALVAPDGDTLLREDGPPLVYAPSATLLFSRGLRETERAHESCLALGYDSAGATRLRCAEEEARSVARLTGGRALVGPAPKKEALFDQAANYRLLHFSCHGEFDPEAPLSSALHLAPGEDLTALEVLDHLRLRCDLVTLSACESGLSRVRRGDELVGLIRAFMYAGAPALVSTLWRVDERSTLVLMERFYREVQAEVGFAEALRRAQLHLRSLPPFTDPYYWAPFIFVGARNQVFRKKPGFRA